MYQISVYSITMVRYGWLNEPGLAPGYPANGKYRISSHTTGPCSAIGKGQL